MPRMPANTASHRPTMHVTCPHLHTTTPATVADVDSGARLDSLVPQGALQVQRAPGVAQVVVTGWEAQAQQEGRRRRVRIQLHQRGQVALPTQEHLEPATCTGGVGSAQGKRHLDKQFEA